MIWMAVTADEYETPLVIEDSLRLLGNKLGVANTTILKMAQRHNDSRLKFNGEHYRVVKIDE